MELKGMDVCADCGQPLDDPAHHCEQCGDHVNGEGICNDDTCPNGREGN